MKLDSIIYDTTTLSNAITEQLVNESPTFKAMYPSETSTALVNLLAGYGSMLQYTIVSAIANCYSSTAFSPTAIYQLSETLGNRLHGNISAKLYCNITRSTLLKQETVIPQNSVFMIEGLLFFNNDAIIFSRASDTVNGVLLTQGEYKTVEFVTTGVSGEKFYFSNDFLCNMNMVKVFINDEEWNTTESFLSLNSSSFVDQEQSNVVMLRMSSDGRAYIKIGNNSNGSLPASGSIVRVEYVSNDGSRGNFEKTNVSAELMTQVYGYENSQPTLLSVNITATQPSYGGFDTQSLEVLKETSPHVFASGNRAIRRDDYKALLINKCGYISANVWGEYEEAQTNGGYDKIMMNMVYYTGIKEIQKYDYRPLKTLSVEDSSEKVSVSNPIFFTDSVGTIRGFPGSYEIDFVYLVDESLQIKYKDKNGNGILVCDPSDNNNEEYLFPYDDSQELYDNGAPEAEMKVVCLQDTESNYGIKRLFKDDNEDFIFNGLSKGIQMRIAFDSPLQIELSFEKNPQAISMFSFKTPNDRDDLDYFPGIISIYATDELEADTRNIKNNSDWERIAEVQTINVPESERSWSDWITTNLFRPENNNIDIVSNGGWRKYKRYMIEFYSLHNEDKLKWGAQCHIGQMKFVLDKKQTERYAWGGQTQGDGTISPTYYTKSLNPKANDEVFDINLNKITDYVVSGTINDETTGLPYLMLKTPGIEPPQLATDICSAGQTLVKAEFKKDEETNTSYIVYKETKKAIDHQTSTINYESNSIIDMCIPALLQGNSSADTMNYYKYNIAISGLTAANGYKTNDMLYYSFDNGKCANIRVANIDNETYECTINNSPGVITDPTAVQTGDRKINVSDVDLKYYYGSNEGYGAKLTVSSEDAIGAFGTFTGNAYNTATAQSIDSPIIEEYNHFTTYVEFKQPRVKNIKINVTIEYSDSNSYRDTKRKVEEAINSIFEITPYYVGKSLNVADIWAAINNVAGVKRFIVTYPVNNISCKPYEFIALPAGNLTITDKFSEDFK